LQTRTRRREGREHAVDQGKQEVHGSVLVVRFGAKKNPAPLPVRGSGFLVSSLLF
jgi:hypothetical protein